MLYLINMNIYLMVIWIHGIKKPYNISHTSFPVPKIYECTLKVELNRLIKLGVLKQINDSKWAAPTFII